MSCVPAAEKGIDLTGAVPEADLTVARDRDKLHQALLNLTHNAVKFTPPSGSVRVRAERGSEKTVVIVVEDTGEGIAAEDLGQVFEKFHQGGDPEPKAKGSGLGVTITKKLVALHGGAIRVTSEPGRVAPSWSPCPPAPQKRPDPERRRTFGSALLVGYDEV